MEHGDGFPLLFQFIKFIVILFVSMFALQGVYFFIVSMIYYLDDENVGKDPNFFRILSVDIIVNEDGEIDHTLVRLYEVIALLTNILLMVITWIFWVKQINYRNLLDYNTKTDADFAVMMYNLPYDLLNSELRDTLKRNVGVDDSQIIYTNKCYEYDYILYLKSQQMKWLQYK